MKLRRELLFIGVVIVMLGVATLAQDTTRIEVLTGQPTTLTYTVSGTIVHVAGGDIVMKMDSGELKDFQVAPDATATTEDGANITLKDAKPGMRLTKTVATTAAPRTIDAIRNIQGKVWHLQPPSLVILTLPEGNRQYRVPQGQKFNVDGTEGSVWDLRKGQEVTATVIRTVPETVSTISESATADGVSPAWPDTAIGGVLLVEEVESAAAAEALPSPMKAGRQSPPAGAGVELMLPDTGSMVPLLGLCGGSLIGVALAWRLIRS